MNRITRPDLERPWVGKDGVVSHGATIAHGHTVTSALDRLWEYENTGKTPEEVERFAVAEKEKRLWVLPCPLGTTVYQLRKEWKKGDVYITSVIFGVNNCVRIMRDHEWGKTVFGSHDEALAMKRKLEEQKQ